jgi:DNA-directed RNA polymerase alpha subunit
MPHRPPDFPTSTVILIKEAQAARVAEHNRAVLARLHSHMNQSSHRKEKQMQKGLFDDCEGPIRGLRLPLNAWNVLDREKITTLAQLTAIADRIERFPGIGAKTALAIRVELGRIAPLAPSLPDPCQPQRLRNP